MCMKLYLVRHGEAVSENVDPRRPLSHDGKKEVEKTAKALRKMGIAVAAIIHSGKKRAQQTADIIQAAIAPELKLIQKDSLGPNDSTEQIYKDIMKRSEDFMIVGHMPFLGKLVSRLVLGDENRDLVKLTTGSVAALECEAASWYIIFLISPEIFS